ncbi:MAG: DUF5786 family protein [Halobacteriales archaeon]
MAMGDYDEDEHERRERKANAIDAEFADDRSTFHGSVEYDDGESAEELLDQFEQIKGT